MKREGHSDAADQSLVRIDVPGARLLGELVIPLAPTTKGVVLFAHGSGSSRHSPRNKFVAQYIREQAHAATLLIDLLSNSEASVDAQTAELRFDIRFLARRLLAICDWLAMDSRTASMPIGLFGASTGAAGALVCAAERGDRVACVVSRGGRPDLAGIANLVRVRAPTLLLVGGNDSVVLELNRQAQRVIRADCKLEVVPGASHLFEEPGRLAEVARHASGWFERHFRFAAVAHAKAS